MTGSRGWRVGALLAATMAVWGAARAADKPVYAIEPAPAWVTPVDDPVPAGAPPASAGGDVRWILVDAQTRIDHAVFAAFRHSIVQALDAHGVDDATHIDISFDPSYQTLALHEVRVRRGGQMLSQLATLDARVLQREPELASRVYDGRLTVSLLLRDVRPGDVVEVAYTLTGRNPVFAGHRFGELDLQAGVPVDHYRQRLLVDASASISVRPEHGAPAAVETRTNGLRDLVWDRRGVPAALEESGAPDAWSDVASVVYTDFADWGAVVRWALPLYRVPAHLGAALQAEHDRLAAANASPEARIVAALRLVQGQVRYLGVEMGANSHAPSDPDRVFGRRYGDCKEKTLLLVTLLRSLGIDASPAVVDTDRRGAIAADLPAPTSFDHAITRVRLGGRTLWLDATRYPQGGDFAHLVQSRYEQALVIAPDIAALETMAPAVPADDVVDETMSFDLSKSRAAPASLDVVTVHRGEQAERMRQQISTHGLDKLQRRYLDWYADTWKSIAVAAPLTTRDDPDANAITIVEHYRVPDAWEGAGAASLPRFNPDEVYDWLDRPPHGARVAPLQLGAPMTRLLRIEARLPEAGERLFDRNGVQAPQFSYERTADLDGRSLRIDYVFRRTAETVSASELPAYAGKIDAVRRIVSWRAAEAAPGSTWWSSHPLLPILVLAVLARVALWWFRRRRAAAADPANSTAPSAPEPLETQPPGTASADTVPAGLPPEGWTSWRLRMAASATCTATLACSLLLTYMHTGWLDATPWHWALLWAGALAWGLRLVAVAERRLRAATVLTLASADMRLKASVLVWLLDAATVLYTFPLTPRPWAWSIVAAGVGLAVLQALHWRLLNRRAAAAVAAASGDSPAGVETPANAARQPLDGAAGAAADTSGAAPTVAVRTSILCAAGIMLLLMVIVLGYGAWMSDRLHAASAWRIVLLMPLPLCLTGWVFMEIWRRAGRVAPPWRMNLPMRMSLLLFAIGVLASPGTRALEWIVGAGVVLLALFGGRITAGAATRARGAPARSEWR